MRLFLLSMLAVSALLFPPAAAQDAQPAGEEPKLEIGAGGRPVGQIWSRSPVYAEHGMAATAHPLASQIAIDILKKGGSAVDAAIAANAALGLMEPTGNGIGGDLFAIVWDPKTQKLHGLNGSGKSAMGTSYAEFIEQLDGLTSIPPLGPLPITVPGAVDGWFELHGKFGKLPMADILAPAISYAHEGHPVSPVIAYYFSRNLRAFERNEAMIGDFSNARATWFATGAPKVGEIFKNPDLGRTLSLIAEGGRDAFYKGEIARTIDAYMRRVGGNLRYEDFAAHSSKWVEPGCVSYRKGFELCELPPNSQGFAALQMANILKNVDLAQYPRGSAEVLHYITEAKRLAFEDVARFYADPDMSPAPLEWLLSDEYGRERFALIDPAKASPAFGPGEPKLEGEGDTTYLTVADKNGMMVSLIQSNYRGMGSGLVADGLGFMFQDRGELYSLDPNHPNVYAPGKRPFQTIIPAFMKKDGQPYMSFGLMGGGMQPQGHVQVMVNIVDYGMNLQEAGDAARLNHEGGRAPTDPLNIQDADLLGVLHVEPGISPETIERLQAMGHKVEVVDNGVMFGGYQAIVRDPETGVYHGATEMRKDGQALGY
ncbi:gamma-glutamyltransferase family protein [Alterisphingorhabdus coralli]|uniref:Gamma-glutamyltransferase family protein n=1 Tax=Alterisphingorhabdus coralli TaxID=3071408 RepID=A0AA97I082_9SPHN|nr:gamma-glutamyltransferase family protein [Parasphingorhabdus sp. SCSIO 66989]WOE75484.1 gamma-glutamyltransferase family protein [Parasphingorhabdus sp. SCSIO 66989]